MMFLFFMALGLQAVLEREVRKTMCEETIDPTPAYPEHKLSAHPTTGGQESWIDSSTYRYTAFTKKTLSLSAMHG